MHCTWRWTPTRCAAEPPARPAVNPPDNTLRLLRRRRFLPFFATQFLGAFNDNVFKNAMLLLVTFHIGSTMDVNFIVNLSAGLFILPFFLFSALAGQLAERTEKAVYMQRLKLLEITIMLIASLGFLLSHVPLLMTALFLMGTQSALFGPAKYSILPQQLASEELMSGNALVESGTFLAILLGTLGGGLLIAFGGDNAPLLSVVVVGVALCGFLVSRFIPATPVSKPDLVLHWNLAAETGRIVGYLRRKPTLFLPVLAISWFWFYGALFLTQLPNYTRSTLGGDGTVATVLLTAFSLGIGVGSMLCNKLCDRKIELGLVPLGALGLTLFALDLGFAHPGAAAAMLTEGALLDGRAFLGAAGNWRVFLDLALIALCGGIYIVPLYTLVQHRCEDAYRSRVIAGNNVLNAAFMVSAALFAVTLLGAGLDIPQLFQATALVNALALALLCRAMPEMPLRSAAWLAARVRRRARSRGFERVPDDPDSGAALLLCRVDKGDTARALLLVLWAAARRMRLAVDADARLPGWLRVLLRWSDAITLSVGAGEQPEITRALAAGETVCVVSADAPGHPCQAPVFLVTVEGDGRDCTIVAEPG